MKKHLAFILSAFALIACEKQAEPETPQPVVEESITISATCTKTAFTGTAGEVAWLEGDVITVFDAEGVAYVSEAAKAGKTTTFTVKNFPASKTPKYAVFCGENPSATYSGGKITTTTKGTQTITSDDNIAPNAAISVGTVEKGTDGYTVNMKNVMGFVKVRISDENVKEVVLGGSTGNALSGKIAITPTSEPTVMATSFESNVTINYSNSDVKTFTVGKDYYFCVLPGTINSPKFTITTADEGIGELQLTEDITVARGEIADAGEIKDVKYTKTINLDENGTANCYPILKEVSTKYCFTPTQGCTSTAVTGIKTVEILWETADGNDSAAPEKNSVVKSVEYKSGKIYLVLPDPNKPGNALIAAKDANGTILWSWHIWILDSEITTTTWTSGMALMDRNLGDFKSAGTPRSSMLYQWGRKDPFPGGRGDSRMIGVTGTTTTYGGAKGSSELAIQNPTVIYGSYTTAEGSGAEECWQADADLWGDNGAKTMFDPCPAGYKVPSAWESYPDDVTVANTRFSDLTNGTLAWYKSKTGEDHYQNTFDLTISGTVVRIPRTAVIRVNTKVANAGNCNYAPTLLKADGGTETASYFWTSTPCHASGESTAASDRRAVLFRVASSSGGATVNVYAHTGNDTDHCAKNNAYAVRCELIQSGTKSSSESVNSEEVNW